MLNKLIATSPTWFTLPIRLSLGALMIAHGAQRVLGSFNGRVSKHSSPAKHLSVSCVPHGSGWVQPRYLN